MIRRHLAEVVGYFAKVETLVTSSRQHHRLLSSRQFRAVYDRGRKFDHALFAAFFLRTETGEQRIGITVTRKLGKAVARNRCKRRLREVFRLREPSSLSGVGYDLVINAKPALTKASFEQIKGAFAQVLRRFSEHVEREDARRAKLTEGGEK